MAECDNYTSASTCQCTQPDSESEADRAQFWREFEEVLDLQKQRVAGGMAGVSYSIMLFAATRCDAI